MGCFHLFPGIMRRRAVQIGLVLCLGILAYSNTFNVPFIFDDQEYIAKNPAIRGFDYFFNSARVNDLPIEQDVKNNFITRPVTYFTFALNNRLHGFDVTGYHIVNLAVHLGTALLVYLLVSLTLATPFFSNRSPGSAETIEGKGSYIPLFAALLFVCHPVQTQGVTYIVQRFTSLATFFYLGSITAYIKSRLSLSPAARAGMYVTALLAAVAAMWTKEISFTLPLVILLYECLFLGGSWKKKLIRTLPLLLTMLIIPLTLLGIASSGGNTGADAVDRSINLINFNNTPKWDYLVTQFRVIATYIRIMVFPVHQNLDYDYPLYHSLFVPEVFASFLFILALFLLALYLLRLSCMRLDPAARWQRMAAFGMLWFFITLSVESSIIPIADLIFEHRLYLPSVGFVIALLSFLEMLKERVPTGKTFARAAATSFLIAAVLCLASATYLRNSMWRDPLLFWQDVAAKSPDKPRPHTHLGNELHRLGLDEEAIPEYRTVLRLNPNAYKAHNSLGIAYASLRQFREAEQEFEAALAIKPDDFSTRSNLGYFYRIRGRTELAIREFRIAAEINPRLPVIHSRLAGVYLDSGNLPGAVTELNAALALEPFNPETHYGLGIAYERLGRIDEATREFAIASELKNKNTKP